MTVKQLFILLLFFFPLLYVAPVHAQNNSADVWYVHIANANNITSYATQLDHPALNNNPAAKILVTPVYNPNSVYTDHVHGLLYSQGRWYIFNQDGAAMGDGSAFHVFKSAENAPTYIHIHTANNGGYNETYLDHPLLNNNANALFFATDHWRGVVSDHTTQVGYQVPQKKWAIVKEQSDEFTPLPEDALFNVYIPTNHQTAFIHTATPSNVTGNYTRINHPALNGNPNAVPIVKPRWNFEDYHEATRANVGVWYTGGRWYIFNQDGSAMPQSATFNVLVPTQSPSGGSPFNAADIVGAPFYQGAPSNVGIGQFQQDRHAAVPGQVLLYGKPEELDQLLSSRATVLHTVTLRSDREMRLIESAISVAQWRNDAANQGLLSITVNANYIVAAPWVIGGAPWVIGGAPWVIGGAPWVIGGAPWQLDPDGSAGSRTPHTIPWQQWPFLAESGINLYTESGSRTVPQTGAGTRIIIFDTSPFTQTGTVTVPSIAQPINVSNPLGVLPTTGTGAIAGLKQHGLFVAGLAHYVAPDAQLELVRVLGDDATGDGSTLVAQLQQLADSSADLSNVIVNLSLGYTPELDPSDSPDTARELAALHQAIRNLRNKGAVVVAAAGNTSSWVEGLDGTRDDINFDYFSDVERYESAIPGRWSDVIDVTGYVVNRYSNRLYACFANGRPAGGDTPNNRALGFNHFGTPSVAAPSGGGLDHEEVDFGTGMNDITLCQQPNDTGRFTLEQMCGTNRASSYDCRSALLSVTTEGYSHWVGTSFGTPLVTGMIALLREACPSADSAAIQLYLESYYLGTIDNSGLGQIDLPTFLQSCPPATPTAVQLTATPTTARPIGVLLPLLAGFSLLFTIGMFRDFQIPRRPA